MWLIFHWLSCCIFLKNNTIHYKATLNSPGFSHPATHGRMTLQYVHMCGNLATKMPSALFVRLFFKKSTCKSNVIRCYSFYERGEIILNTDTQWVYLFRNLLNRVWEFKYSTFSLYRTGQEPERSLQKDPVSSLHRRISEVSCMACRQRWLTRITLFHPTG